jgi:hypothetical protein
MNIEKVLKKRFAIHINAMAKTMKNGRQDGPAYVTAYRR